MKGDVIKLAFPAKPDYILAIRLAVSAIAERIGFDVDDIEDLKVASAEACVLLLSSVPETLDISIVAGDGIKMDIIAAGQTKGSKQEDETSDLSRYLLEALVDKCEFVYEDDIIKGVSFYKKQ
ncbi:MAG: hypothetical protein PHO15_03730 [Eubacteriales bacterium]|nr:hypothetical protein [Eubacteriales bacterium]